MKLSKGLTLTALFCTAHSLPAILDGEISVTGNDGTRQDLSVPQVKADVPAESEGRDFIGHLEKRTNVGDLPGRVLKIPSKAGSVTAALGVITIQAIVNQAEQLSFIISNSDLVAQTIEIREQTAHVAAVIVQVAAQHMIPYNPYGGLKPGQTINFVHYKSS
ncbi:hypothetical protein ONS95_005737 [Cadophora gregata]|uniref:uncharacterized protein n=1 Tax=Cadophora gregata TaxID=51156 RepID=UPI0026DDB993|nr:uncharacterized protein ONS95_005737 [Cadophora gregata]KAK0103731.1 hypothetical protein ONS95_005737 [Cadophora gregata]KAK0107918.1 hypothetical protein ONS96_003705 [Cadophora gregata f. sp. sojae]